MSTNSQIAFAPLGKTVLIAADVAAPTGIQAPVNSIFSAQSTGQYRIVNSGNDTVFLGTGSTAALAATNSAAPTAGNPSPAIVLLSGAVEILRFNTGTFFSGTAAAANSVFITPGQGI